MSDAQKKRATKRKEKKDIPSPRPVVKDPSKAPKRTPIKKILNQLALGATQTQVAKSVNVSKQSVSAMLQRYGIDNKWLDSFKENRADIMAGIQETVAASLTADDINKASVRDRTILFGTLYDKERLERGLSTSNQAVLYASAVEMAFSKPENKPENKDNNKLQSQQSTLVEIQQGEEQREETVTPGLPSVLAPSRTDLGGVGGHTIEAEME